MTYFAFMKNVTFFCVVVEKLKTLVKNLARFEKNSAH